MGIKEFIERTAKVVAAKTDGRMTIKVLMVGGKRCGKSTVLTSIWQNMDKITDGTDLSLSINNSYLGKLQETLELAKEYFDNVNPNQFKKVSDANSTSEIRRYNFQLELVGKNTGIDIEFTDVTGEYFGDEKHFEETKQLINESHVLMLAIDAPSLMEGRDKQSGYGPKHVAANKVFEITNFIRSELTVDQLNRMVLFVPIKCEKYFYKNQVDTLVEAVKGGYAELLQYLNSPAIQACCTTALLPIISLGGLEFSHYDPNQDKSPTADQFYAYCEKATYQPKYCEQPLLYTLDYVAEAADQFRTNGIWKLMNRFFGTPNGKELQKELRKLASQKKITDAKQGFISPLEVAEEDSQGNGR